MSIRTLSAAAFALFLTLGAAGCGAGIKEGLPENLTPSAELLHQDEEVGKLNVKTMRR